MKRIVICCDGTWQDDEQPTMKSPSNVTLISRAINAITTDGTTEQIVFYQQGIGTSLDYLTRVRTGAFGLGLLENIREAYGFVVHNWQPGDELYFFGWSRGAYTARSVAGLICDFGLLTKRGMDGIAYVLEAYANQTLMKPATMADLTSKYERASADVPIEFVGVWDTVGSLGIPDVYIFGMQPPGINALLGQINAKYQFSDTNPHPNIKNAVQSLALNEDRAPFTPTLWKLAPDNKSTRMIQVWFVGAHSSVGGAAPSHGLSDIALAWMVQQVVNHTGLEFNVQYLIDSRKTFSPNQMNTPWGTEPWIDPYTGIWRLSGYKLRTPGEYLTKQDPEGTLTNEFVHKSVLTRIKDLGKKYWHPGISSLKEAEFGPLEQELSWK